MTPRDACDSGFAEAEELLDRVFGNPFYAIYRRQAETVELAIAFRGGSGSVADAKEHPGSPARAFIEGSPARRVPAEVQELVGVLLPWIKTTLFPVPQRDGASPTHSQETDAVEGGPGRNTPHLQTDVLVKDGPARDGATASTSSHCHTVKIRVLGYSMGGLPALGTALLLQQSFSDPEDLDCTCILLNPVAAFWPKWLYTPKAVESGANSEDTVEGTAEGTAQDTAVDAFDSSRNRPLLPHNWWATNCVAAGDDFRADPPHSGGEKVVGDSTTSTAPPPPFSFGRITSWVVKNDPFAESVRLRGDSVKLPLFPGLTRVLPARSKVDALNHALQWFLEREEGEVLVSAEGIDESAQ